MGNATESSAEFIGNRRNQLGGAAGPERFMCGLFALDLEAVLEVLDNGNWPLKRAEFART